jgi:hypothetical protein
MGLREASARKMSARRECAKAVRERQNRGFSLGYATVYGIIQPKFSREALLARYRICGSDCLPHISISISPRPLFLSLSISEKKKK